MKSDRKPPLPKSPIRLRPRRVLRPSTASTTIQTPSGSLAKSRKPNQSWAINDQELRPEYRTIAFELQTLADEVHKELAKGESENHGVFYPSSANSTTIFERGRCYEKYAALRNEWLKRKKGISQAKTGYGLEVAVESVKRSSSKKLSSLRKSVSAACSVETPRYMLRSMTKENKKPPLPPLKWDKALPGEESKLATRRARRI